MAITDIFMDSSKMNAETKRLVADLDDTDSAALAVVEHEWEVNNLKDPFLLMQLALICKGLQHRVDKRYKNRGSAWKRKVRQAFQEYAISFGMRLTKVRMERARYE